MSPPDCGGAGAASAKSGQVHGNGCGSAADCKEAGLLLKHFNQIKAQFDICNKRPLSYGSSILKLPQLRSFITYVYLYIYIYMPVVRTQSKFLDSNP